MGDIAIDLVTRSERKSIYFDNLCFSVSKPERIDILKNLRGYFNAGRLSAIIGPSGAGKSTFLNILSGFKKPSNESTLLINGERISQSFIRKNSAYIAQDTTFLGKLTTKETLEYAAKFKLPTNTSISERSTIVRLRIDDIVKLLGLEKCLHNHVEKLSGGEWKRLAIGEELITNPPVMIFDEPTSGLDSVSTIQVVKHLKDLAQSGRTVICVIHQLSSLVLEYFDDVYVLSNGQCIYNGSVEDIVPRFQEAGFYCPQYYNRADFILDVASGQRQGNLELLLSKARENIQMQDMIEKSFHAINTSTNGKLIK
ncbi:ATP-binding cassette sub-family G member 4-like [Lutzomyia longipalpis]|uniref:ATP-binding cassette sub-family G member 4-like n=1 Tax=Lutzomyia longipalpis TaxID=7200 RepID=UPI0024837962|nr:ATP-binding cassette sub-family G member 4-like [Lutzomyia longipalpis]